jgi:hypothetical protein
MALAERLTSSISAVVSLVRQQPSPAPGSMLITPSRFGVGHPSRDAVTSSSSSRDETVSMQLIAVVGVRIAMTSAGSSPLEVGHGRE